jgi:hypothetical protein
MVRAPQCRRTPRPRQARERWARWSDAIVAYSVRPPPERGCGVGRPRAREHNAREGSVGRWASRSRDDQDHGGRARRSHNGGFDRVRRSPRYLEPHAGAGGAQRPHTCTGTRNLKSRQDLRGQRTPRRRGVGTNAVGATDAPAAQRVDSPRATEHLQATPSLTSATCHS